MKLLPQSSKSALTPLLPVLTPLLPVLTPLLPVLTPLLPVLTPSLPVLTPSQPVLTPSLVVLTSSLPVLTPSLPVPAFASLPASTIPLSLPHQAAPIPSSVQQPPSLSPCSSLLVVLDLEDGLAPKTLDGPMQHANGRLGKGAQAETSENGQ